MTTTQLAAALTDWKAIPPKGGGTVTQCPKCEAGFRVAKCWTFVVCWKCGAVLEL